MLAVSYAMDPMHSDGCSLDCRFIWVFTNLNIATPNDFILAPGKVYRKPVITYHITHAVMPTN